MNTRAKKSISKALALLLAFTIALSVQVFYQPDVAKAAGTTYYVSTSGNDSNNGTSPNTPWKTLSKVSSQWFGPGDQILLKRGDTWTGEALYPKANGASPDNWVYLSAYGDTTLDKPKIFPNNGAQAAIAIVNEADYYNQGIANAGWKITDIEVGYALHGIAAFDWRTNINPYWESMSLNGLWVENCYIHDITGRPRVNFDPVYYFSTGIRTQSQNGSHMNVTIKNNYITKCDVGTSLWFTNNVNLESNYLYNQDFHGMEFCWVHYGTVRNNRVIGTGQAGHPFGTAGIEFDSGTQNLIVEHNEVAYTLSPNQYYDGCGIDYETDTYNVTCKNNYIHDNAASAFLFSDQQMYSYILDNLCVNNGIDWDRKWEPGFITVYNCFNNQGQISGNIIKLIDNQTISLLDGSNTNAMPYSFTNYNNTILQASDPLPADLNWSLYGPTDNPPDTPDPSPSNPPILPDPSPSNPPTPPPQEGNLKAWEFNTDGDREGWGNWYDLTTVEASGGYLKANVTGGDPYIFSSDNLGIPINSNTKVEICLKNGTSANKAQLFFITEADGGFNEAKMKEFAITSNDANHTVYTVDLSSISAWSGTLRRLRLDPEDGANSGSISIDYIRILGETTDPIEPDPSPSPSIPPTPPPQEGNLKAWEFNTDGDREGWGNWFDLTAVETSDGYLKANVTGGDPYIFSSDNLGISINSNTKVEICLKNGTSANKAQLYFITEADGGFNDAKMKEFAITSNDANHTVYTVDLSSISAWSGTLRRLRLDPEDGANSGSISIDYIRILGETVNPIDPDPSPSPSPSTANGPAWEFNTNGNMEGWRDGNNVWYMGTTDGYLYGTVAGNNPYIYSPDNLGYTITGNKTITIRIKNTTPSTGLRIYFVTDSNSWYNDEKSKLFTNIANDNEYHEYVLDMSSAEYTGTLKQIRIDPQASSGTFNIDYIRIGW